MPVQTQKKGHIYFPDGAQVLVKTKADEEFFDVGAINSAVTSTLNWTESVVETANAGKLDTKISDMQVAGGFTLINLDPEGIGKMGGGVFKIIKTGSEPITPKPQTIAGGIKKGVVYPLVMVDPASGNEVRLMSAPQIASVTAGPGKSSPITAETGYVIVETDACASGWGILFTQAGAESNESNDVTITYSSGNTPVAGTAITCGNSSVILKPYAMRIVHTDDNGKKRSLDLYSVYSNSGGFQFNFKGANEEGIEEMPITFTANLDTTRTNNQQLMTWNIETGAN